MGNGTQTLNQSNSYSGGTTLNAGSLVMGNANALGTGELTINGGTLNLNGNNLSQSAFTQSGGALGTNGSTQTLTASTYALNGGTVNAALGAGTINVGGNATLNGTAASTTINVNNEGILTLGGTDRLANTAAVTINAGGTLDIGAYNDTVDNLTLGGGTLGGSGKLTASTYALNGGEVNANLGGGAATVAADTTMRGGAEASLTINTGRTLTINISAGANRQFSGGISGNGALTKTGAGTATLSAANTFTGQTTVDGGTLKLAAGSSLASSVINVGSSSTKNGTLDARDVGGLTIGSSQTLSGYGTVIGATTVNGNLSPGNSPGILTIDGDLVLGGTSTTTLQVYGTGAAGDPLNGYDKITLTSGKSITYGGALVLEINSISGGYTINNFVSGKAFDFTGLNGGNFSSVSITGNAFASGQSLTYYSANNTWQIWDAVGLNDQSSANYIGINLDTGVLTVVPEPSTYALFGLGALALVIAHRRRKAQA
jgi:autotransporter-associated beta strand protein